MTEKRATGLRHRLKRALRRRRQDGRLPESTSRLYREHTRLVARDAVARAVAAILPPVGGWRSAYGSPIRPSGEGRAWYTAGRAEASTHEIAHDLAQAVVEGLEKAGLSPFLTEASDTRLTFGLPARDRAEALSALKESLDGPWYLTWLRGGRPRTTLLANAKSAAPLAAESWEVFRLHQTGPDSFMGRDEAPFLTFWAEEADGWSERIGYRGLHRFNRKETNKVAQDLDGRIYPGIEVFPVARDLSRFIEPVDIVYTWVDGDDPAWRQEFELWSTRDAGAGGQAAHPARFRSVDELRYSLRSVWLYAGWFRHLYLVTSGQVPTWLRDHERITVVRHAEIIETDHLPTFNSHAIEARLHLIEGLSEHFIYMNDDVFLGRPTERADFFTPGGSLRFVVSEALIPSRISDATISVDQAAVNNRRLVEEAFGRSVRFKLDHAPHPLRRSVAYEIEDLFPEQVSATVSHRFRSSEDISIASGLTQFVAALSGRGEPSAIRNGYMNLENPRLRLFLRVLRLGRGFDSFCLNQTETEASPGRGDIRVDEVAAFLSSYFGVGAPWEVV